MRILVASDQWFPDLKGGAARVATEMAVRLADLGHDVTVLVPRAPGLPTEEREGLLTVPASHRASGGAQDDLGRRPDGDPYKTCIGAVRPSGRAPVHERSGAPGRPPGRTPCPRFPRLGDSASSGSLRSTLPRGPGRLVDLRARGPARRARARRRTASGHDPSPQRVQPIDSRRRPRRARSPGTACAGWSRHRRVQPGRRPGGRAAAAGTGRRDARPAPDRQAARAADGARATLCAVALLPDRPILAVVGGHAGRSLRRLASELGLSENVRFTGRVADDVLKDWYRAADLFVLPTVAYEGFGMATAEALASGTPVIGTPVGATPELLEPLDPRLVAPGTDPEALAAGITAGIELARTELERPCAAPTPASISAGGRSWSNGSGSSPRRPGRAARGRRGLIGRSARIPYLRSRSIGRFRSLHL